jgi:phosphoglycerol transferase MdoB-like AlkP superfamily enzyme
MPNPSVISPARRSSGIVGFTWFCVATLLVLFSGLRIFLLVKFVPDGLPWSETRSVLLEGLRRDVFVALVLVLPWLGWAFVVPRRWMAKAWHRHFFWLVCFVWWLVEIFLLGTEFFFFDEFQSRFNTVAVDYILYPHEVFVNIWDSYPVVKVLIGCASLAAVWWIVARIMFSGMWSVTVKRGRAFGAIIVVLILLVGLAPTINFKGARVGKDRTLNEIANNGSIAFVCAAWTRNLDFAGNYKTLPAEEAYARTRKILAAPGMEFVKEGSSIHRRVAGDSTKPRLNVVLFLEESLGSEFWGCLGRTNTLTPEMDALALGEGLLFTNIYACGNRTVRGMEGVLASFPPLPGDSIVKRDKSDNVETLARVLKRDGYDTVFFYGGRGLFDGMRSFALRNGYDRFIEQKDLPDAKFTTIWGVDDEEVFLRANNEFKQLASAGKSFFSTILSVSNHKPYTYPAGRIPEDPNEHRRENAVKYSDFALGEFFRAAKKEPYWTNTIFVVVADHGARVYGSQSIPIHSYEIPLVILGPAVVKKPDRIGYLGNSLDVAPTILGLLGRPYETMFFGRDLLGGAPAESRAVVNHNRSVGLYRDGKLIVLGLKQGVEFYAGDPKREDIKSVATPDTADLEQEKDAIALFQVADDLYTREGYRIELPTTNAVIKR